MNPLTSEECLLLLDLLSQKVVVSRSDDFPFTITKKGSGYSGDDRISNLQMKLSIMLESASRCEARNRKVTVHVDQG